MSPNPFAVALSILRSRRLRHPAPTGTGRVAHDDLHPILQAVATEGIYGLGGLADGLASYLERLGAVDPDVLSRDEALAFWLNLYNAGALDLARRTAVANETTVLRVPGGFRNPFITVADEALSLDGIEHGKIRRFGDPRIHGALVCGSASCPTLRSRPYDGSSIDADLDDQMRSFLSHGGAVADREHGVLALSRIFAWYGADFVRPSRMPTLIPTTKSKVRVAVTTWLPKDMLAWIGATSPKVEYMDYDWSLGCSVR